MAAPPSPKSLFLLTIERQSIRLALIGTTEEQAATLAALNHAKTFLRHELTERLQLFKTPELHFEAALAADLAAKAKQILKRIERGRPKERGL